MPLHPEEFQALAARLAELEDFLKEQRVLALGVRHSADAAVLEGAMSRVISIHALVQLLTEGH